MKRRERGTCLLVMSTWERPGVECDIESDVGDGKMAQWLGALSGLLGDLGTVSSTHNHL